MKALYHIDVYWDPPLDRWHTMPSFSCMKKSFAMGAWAMLKSHYGNKHVYRLRKGSEVLELLQKTEGEGELMNIYSIVPVDPKTITDPVAPSGPEVRYLTTQVNDLAQERVKINKRMRDLEVLNKELSANLKTTINALIQIESKWNRSSDTALSTHWEIIDLAREALARIRENK